MPLAPDAQGSIIKAQHRFLSILLTLFIYVTECAYVPCYYRSYKTVIITFKFTKRITLMKINRICFAAALAVSFLTFSTYADMNEFNADKMLSELESQLKLSSDKLSEMKPAIDAKSVELNTIINDSVEKGFIELDKLSDQLEADSIEAQEKLKESLSGEEMQQLKDFLKKWDSDAINQTRQDLATQLAVFLKLTEDQIASLKPVLEDSFNQLAEMLDALVMEGNKNLEEFKQQYEALSQDLNQKLKDTLNSDQMKSLELHREELNEKIKASLYSA